jgi:hypothetical protein
MIAEFLLLFTTEGETKFFYGFLSNPGKLDVTAWWSNVNPCKLLK